MDAQKKQREKNDDIELTLAVVQECVPDGNRACLLWCHEQYIILTILCLGLNCGISLSTSKVLRLDSSLF